LLEEPKLDYALEILVPLGLIPLRRPLSLLFSVPGFIFTLLTTGYSPTISLHYQYATYWTTFMFVALVLVFETMPPLRRSAAAGALVLASAVCSHQYGSILQTHTSWDGPIPYKFGISREDRHRRRALDVVVAHVPKDAKVVASAFVTVQLSSRADAYSLTLGVYDAHFLVFPSDRSDFIADELRTVTGLLSDGSFGVVAVEPPFAVAQRGHPTGLNQGLLAALR